MPLKKAWDAISTPLVPDLDIQNPWGDLAFDVLREFTSPGEIAATLALGGGNKLLKIPKYGKRIHDIITAAPTRTAAKSYISADMLENVPVAELTDPNREPAGVDYLKAGIFGGLAALPWGLDAIGRRASRVKPKAEPDIPDVKDDIQIEPDLLSEDMRELLVIKRKDHNRRIRTLFSDAPNEKKRAAYDELSAAHAAGDLPSRVGGQPSSFDPDKEGGASGMMRVVYDELLGEVDETPIDKLDLDDLPELRRGSYADTPEKKRQLELAKNILYKGPGAAGRPPIGEDLWKIFLTEGVMPQGEDLPRAYGYLRDIGLIKGKKQLTPDEMQSVLTLASKREGLKKEIRRLQQTSVTDENILKLDPSLPFEQAMHQFANHWRISKVLGGKNLAKQNLQELKGYLEKTGLAGREDVQKVVKNVRDLRQEKWVRWFTNLGQLTKGLRLTAGVPNTALNIHGFSIAKRALFDKHAPTMKTLYTMIRPNIAKAELDEMGDALLDYQRSGINFQTERDVRLHEGIESVIGASWEDVFPGITKREGIADKFTEWQDKVFGAPLFERVLPLLKINSFKGMRDDLVKNGMDFKTASYNAARTVNSRYGGVDQKGLVWKGQDGLYKSRSRELNQMLRAFFLAPDWLETNRRHFIASMPKPALRVFNRIMNKMTDGKEIDIMPDVERKALQATARWVIGTYMVASTTQKATTGKWMHENPRGKRWNIKVGDIKDEKGKDIYIPLGLGTADDFARIPVEIVSEGFEGDIPDVPNIIRGRTSQPVKLGLNLLKNTDFADRPLIGDDKYGRRQSLGRQAGNVGRELLDTVIPQYPDAAISYLMDEYSLPQALSQGLEIPIQFHRPYRR